MWNITAGLRVIAGDFNCPSIDWVSLKAPADSSQDALLDFAVTQGLSQIVQAPTRGDNQISYYSD